MVLISFMVADFVLSIAKKTFHTKYVHFYKRCVVYVPHVDPHFCSYRYMLPTPTHKDVNNTLKQQHFNTPEKPNTLRHYIGVTENIKF